MPLSELDQPIVFDLDLHNGCMWFVQESCMKCNVHMWTRAVYWKMFEPFTFWNIIAALHKDLVQS